MFETINFESPQSAILTKIEKNCKEAEAIRKQIRELEAIPRAPKEEPTTPPEVVFSAPKEEEQSSDGMEEYIRQYRRIENATREDLLSILPSKDSYEFNDVIYRLLAESLREMKEMTEIQIEEGISLEEKIDFIENEKRKTQLLQELLAEEEKMEEQIEDENIIVLVPNKNGKIFALDDLSRITVDHYDEIYDLIQSIIHGTFKKLRRFKTGTNSSLGGASEVRGSQGRIIFKRLNHNTYALFSVFLKKTNNDRGYQEYLKKRISEFREVEEIIKEKIQDERFMRLNDEFVQELWNRLGKSEEAKKLKKGLDV